MIQRAIVKEVNKYSVDNNNRKIKTDFGNFVLTEETKFSFLLVGYLHFKRLLLHIIHIMTGKFSAQTISYVYLDIIYDVEPQKEFRIKTQWKHSRPCQIIYYYAKYVGNYEK